MQSKYQRIDKKFGHCMITWEVRNFCLAVCKEKFVFRSPQFTLQLPQPTEWRMELETSNEGGCVSFHLERLESDPGPDVVWVNWKVAFLDARGKEFTDSECECLYERNQNRGVDVESIKLVLENMPAHFPDTLEIQVQMIVKHEPKTKKLLEETHVGFKSLSEDFKRMFRRGKYYDVVLRIGNKNIRVHKAVLAIRNEKFELLISAAEHSKIVHLSEADAQAIEAVITYLYTGNLLSIFENISIAVIKCILFFGIRELEVCLAPEQFYIVSKVRSLEKSFRWLIPDCAINSKDHICHELLTMRETNLTWRLHLYPFGVDGSSQVMAIFAEVVTAAECRDVCVEFAILDTFSELGNIERVHGQLVVGERIGVEYFLDRFSLRDVLRKGVLRIVFTAQISKGEQQSEIRPQSSDIPMEYAFTRPYYCTLSDAMKILLRDSTYSDIVLKSGTMRMKAHKCVLDARSSTFSQILSHYEGEITVDMTEEVLPVFLNYMYSGCLAAQPVEVITQLFKAAQKYSIPTLEWDCSMLLRKNITEDTVSEILTFAEDNQDEELKTLSLNFISSTDMKEESKS